jgi:hypothetical protein
MTPAAVLPDRLLGIHELHPTSKLRNNRNGVRPKKLPTGERVRARHQWAWRMVVTLSVVYRATSSSLQQMSARAARIWV